MTNPLTLMMPVLPGASLIDLISTLEESRAQIDVALESIGTVHFARTVLLDRSKPNLQPDMQSTTTSDTLIIGVITEYDGNFNDYIHDFVAQLGGVFDALLPFVIGGAALTPVANHVAALDDFISANDASQHIPNDSLYAAYPQTVQQILAAV